MTVLLSMLLCAAGLFVLRAGRSSAWRSPTHRPSWRLNASSRRWFSRPREDRTQLLVQLIRRMAALLRAGRSGASLWRDLREVDAESDMDMLLARAAVAAEAGLSAADAVRCQALTEPDPGIRESMIQLAAVLQIAELTGAPLADLLERLAGHLDHELDTRALRRNALAGPLSTARLLLWLPPLGLLVATGMGIDVGSVVVRGPTVPLTLGAGLILMLVSRLWVRQLVARAERP